MRCKVNVRETYSSYFYLEVEDETAIFERAADAYEDIGDISARQEFEEGYITTIIDTATGDAVYQADEQEGSAT